MSTKKPKPSDKKSKPKPSDKKSKSKPSVKEPKGGWGEWSWGSRS